MVSLLLFCLQMSFSINFANNLIEKSPTSAAPAIIIDPTIVFLDGEDHLRPPKNIESEEWVGINHNICGGTQ